MKRPCMRCRGTGNEAMFYGHVDCTECGATGTQPVMVQSLGVEGPNASSVHTEPFRGIGCNAGRDMSGQDFYTGPNNKQMPWDGSVPIIVEVSANFDKSVAVLNKLSYTIKCTEEQWGAWNLAQAKVGDTVSLSQLKQVAQRLV